MSSRGRALNERYWKNMGLDYSGRFNKPEVKQAIHWLDSALRHLDIVEEIDVYLLPKEDGVRAKFINERRDHKQDFGIDIICLALNNQDSAINMARTMRHFLAQFLFDRLSRVFEAHVFQKSTLDELSQDPIDVKKLRHKVYSVLKSAYKDDRLFHEIDEAFEAYYSKLHPSTVPFPSYRRSNTRDILTLLKSIKNPIEGVKLMDHCMGQLISKIAQHKMEVDIHKHRIRSASHAKERDILHDFNNKYRTYCQTYTRYYDQLNQLSDNSIALGFQREYCITSPLILDAAERHATDAIDIRLQQMESKYLLTSNAAVIELWGQIEKNEALLQRICKGRAKLSNAYERLKLHYRPTDNFDIKRLVSYNNALLQFEDRIVQLYYKENQNPNTTSPRGSLYDLDGVTSEHDGDSNSSVDELVSSISLSVTSSRSFFQPSRIADSDAGSKSEETVVESRFTV